MVICRCKPSTKLSLWMISSQARRLPDSHLLADPTSLTLTVRTTKSHTMRWHRGQSSRSEEIPRSSSLTRSPVTTSRTRRTYLSRRTRLPASRQLRLVPQLPLTTPHHRTARRLTACRRLRQRMTHPTCSRPAFRTATSQLPLARQSTPTTARPPTASPLLKPPMVRKTSHRYRTPCPVLRRQSEAPRRLVRRAAVRQAP